VDLMVEWAKKNNQLKTVLETIYQTTLTDMEEDKERNSEFVQMLVKGNFENEVRVNIDAEGSLKLWGLAQKLRLEWLPDTDLSPDGTHSEWWTSATGYSSANPIHSMLAEAKPSDPKYTQQYSFDKMIEFTTKMIEQAITLLRQEKGKGITNDFKKAVRSIGSVLHTIQDSACACTPRHWTIQKQDVPTEHGVYASKLQHARNCIEGDGHSVMQKVGDRWLVAAMSDTKFYDGRHDHHAQLDTLYANGRVIPISDMVNFKSRKDINDYYDSHNHALWGDNDPAWDGAKLIMAIARAANTNQNVQGAANNIVSAWVTNRYIPKAGLRMPTIEQSKFAKSENIPVASLMSFLTSIGH